MAPLEVPRTEADVVILAGDIGRPATAIPWAQALGKPALYVPGNHEFYGGSLTGTVAELRRLSEGTRIRVLDNEEVVVGGVRFLASTLWTDFLLQGPGELRDAAMLRAACSMRDFTAIQGEQGVFTPGESAALFGRNAAWLEHRLSAPHQGPTVVITHHAPSVKSIHPRFTRSPLNACFVSRAEHLLAAGPCALWIHGHTHDSFDYRVHGTRVVCNARGYAKDGVTENGHFDPALVLEIP